ncbi:MAG: Ppx/GppA family phosphatase [Spirochaetaceae bacterium]|nr:MAG: Ppx/GppA family phosphatase [Spirochaetaceae bacterium]
MSAKDQISRIAAVIDIGSSAIRLVVAQLGDGNEWSRLDRAAKPVSLGRDVFMTGSLSRESMQQAIAILTGFKELLRGWQVPTESVRVVATSAIREARNRDTFVDRVAIRTGLKIDVIEGIEENHLTYLAVQHAVNPMKAQFSRANSMIIEVGGGTTEIMLLRRGKMAAAHSLRIGTVRMEHEVRPLWASGERIEEYLRENVRVSQELLDSELRMDRIRYFVAVGGDARHVAHAVGTQKGDHYWSVTRADFDAYLDKLQDSTVDQIVRTCNVTYNEAEGLVPALTVYRLFLEHTAATELIVPDVSIREGILISFALGSDWAVERQFYGQVIASAASLARRYQYDEAHARQVADLSLMLFDQLQSEHALDHHGRMLLEVAAIVHDIGTYIRASGHHKHGQYIIQNSELFGLSRDDLRVISNVVRYHRKAVPGASHPEFVALRREQRTQVMKLAAILRIADALDRGHAQRIQSVQVEVGEIDVILHCESEGDISTERRGFDLKADMFEQVFGLNVIVA